MRTFRPKIFRQKPRRQSRESMIKMLNKRGGYSHDYLNTKTTTELENLSKRYRGKTIEPFRGVEISRHAIKLTG